MAIPRPPILGIDRRSCPCTCNTKSAAACARRVLSVGRRRLDALLNIADRAPAACWNAKHLTQGLLTRPLPPASLKDIARLLAYTLLAVGCHETRKAIAQ